MICARLIRPPVYGRDAIKPHDAIARMRPDTAPQNVTADAAAEPHFSCRKAEFLAKQTAMAPYNVMLLTVILKRNPNAVAAKVLVYCMIRADR